MADGSDQGRCVRRRARNRDAYLVGHGLGLRAVVLPSFRRDRNVRASSAPSKSKGESIQLGLSGLAPSQYPEVDGDTPVVCREGDGEFSSINRH